MLAKAISLKFNKKSMERRRLIGNAKDWYISDGLIAMWDGEFNAGDAHNSSATTWKDMIGGYVLNGTNATWGDKYAVFGGSTFFTTTNSSIRSILNTGKSVEIVYKTTDTSAYQMMFCANGWYICALQASGVGLKGFNPGGANVPENFYSNSAVQDTNIHTYSAQYPTWGLVVDNVTQSTATKNGNGVDTGSYFIGKRTYNGSNGGWCKGSMYCLRIYNKVLTADEIAHNYNIDLQRFV